MFIYSVLHPEIYELPRRLFSSAEQSKASDERAVTCGGLLMYGNKGCQIINYYALILDEEYFIKLLFCIMCHNV